MKEEVEKYRHALIEMVADYDDDLVMKILEGEEPTVEEIKAAIRKATITGDFYPVLCGASYKNKGVTAMLDAVVDYLPSPLDVPAITGLTMDGDADVRHSSDEEPFSSLAFKVMTDPFVGRLTYFRVYSGTITSGSYVYNATKDVRERFGRIMQMHANHRQEIQQVYSGDIAAAVGLKNTTTGDTLCDEKHAIILESRIGRAHV